MIAREHALYQTTVCVPSSSTLTRISEITSELNSRISDSTVCHCRQRLPLHSVSPQAFVFRHESERQAWI